MPFSIRPDSERGKRTREARTNAKGRKSSARKARAQYANDAVQNAVAAGIDKRTARKAERERKRALKAARK